jgi:hypothetical protein
MTVSWMASLPYETLVDSVASLIERLSLADGRLAPAGSRT